MGWGTLNMISSIGAAILAFGVLLFVINVILSFRAGRVAGANPWEAAGLEWATTSPPPVYNFPHLPAVASRTPLWDEGEGLPVMTGLRVDDRELLIVTVIDAIPSVREPSPKPTIWPLLSAIAIGVCSCGRSSPRGRWSSAWCRSRSR